MAKISTQSTARSYPLRIQAHGCHPANPNVYTEEMGEAIRRRARIKGVSETADKIIETVQKRRGGTYRDIDALTVVGIPNNINRWILHQNTSHGDNSSLD